MQNYVAYLPASKVLSVFSFYETELLNKMSL